MEEQQDGKRIAGMSRRAFSLGCGGAVALFALGGLGTIPAQAQVRPPGGQDEEHLIASCIRCERCIEACPNRALTPAHIEDGVFETRLPVAHFDRGYCDFCQEENGGSPKCVMFCPTQALRLPDGATPETVILGKARIIQDWCLAYNRYNGCRFCYDACPYEAMTLDEYNRPVVITDACNGCGACQSVCVSLQEGAVVEGATTRAIIVEPSDQSSGA